MPAGSSSMPYYTTRPVSAYYTDMTGSAAQTPMAMTAYDQYAVSPLTIPTSTATALGGPVGPPPLPTQHRASSGAWAPQDDQMLLQARAAGQNWNQIQATYFPGKSGNACRKRHERLMERKGANGWDQRKMERISKEYMSMRKEIWSPLAQRCGEKWMVVENKCMSNGLKNIQTHARAYARKERLASGQPLTGYDDDDDGMSAAELDDLQEMTYSSPTATSSSGGGGGSGSGGGAPLSAGGSSTTSSGGGSSGTLGMTSSSYPMHSQTSYSGYSGYSAAAAAAVQQHQQHQQQHHHHAHHHHQYTPVSASGSAGGYVTQAGTISQDGSPYMDPGSRLPSAGEMGIDAIINRGPGGVGGV